MHRRMCVGMIAVVVTIAACKKPSPEGGVGSAGTTGSAAVGSNAEGASATAGGSAADGSSGDGSSADGSSASGAGSNAMGAGSNAMGAGTAAGSAGSAAANVAVGSAGAGSGLPGTGAADASYDKAAFLADPLCREVADKIRACVDKPEFIAALDEDATAADKKVNARLRKAVPKWQKASELCGNTWDIINYEYTGFLDSPGAFKAPGALASCASLGAAVKAAGGLLGGDTAE